MTNPFKGPSPLGKTDPIFGRDQEISALFRQLISDRIVLLHSPSGCGKSSLVEAGLRRRLTERNDFDQLDTIRLKGLLEDGSLSGEQKTLSVMASLQVGAERFRFAFFDQFEEVITARGFTPQDRFDFFKSLGVAIDDKRLWVVIAIRDDYVGALQTYLRLLPTRLASRFRLGPLPIKSAEEAMEKTCQNSGVQFGTGASSELAALLTQGYEGQDGLVEPVHLQVVCRYLWDKCRDKGVIEIADLAGTQHNSVDDALGKYYAECLELVARKSRLVERDLRDWFGETLVEKQQRGRTRVSEGGTPTLDHVNELENHYLIRKDKVQEGDRGVMVELAHDRLVAPVLHNNTVWMAENFGQEWMARAKAWEETPRADLLVEGHQLTDALKYRRKNKIRPREELYLDACFAERRKRAARKRLTVGLWVAALLAVVTTAWAIYASASASAKIADAAAITAKAEKKAAEAEEKAGEAEKKASEAKEKAGEAEKKASEAEQKAAKAKTDEAKAKDDADGLRSLSALKNSELASLELERNKAESAAKRANEDAKAAQRTIEASRGEQLILEDAIKRRDAQKKSLELTLRILEKVGEAQSDRKLYPIVQALEEAINVTAADKSAEIDKKAAAELFSSGIELLPRELLVQTTGFGQPLLLAIGAGASRLTAITPDGRARCWEAGLSSCYEPVTRWSLEEGASISAAAIDGAGLSYAVGDRNGKIYSSVLDKPIEGSNNEIVTLSISRTGKYLAAASSLWGFKAWELRKSRLEQTLHRPGSSPFAWIEWAGIFFSSSNRLVNAIAIHEFDKEVDGVSGLLALARQDGRLVVWPVNAGVHRRTPLFKDPEKDLPPALSVAFSDEGLLAVGYRNGQIKLWDMSRFPEPSSALSGQRVGECGGQANALAFSPGSSRLLAAGCEDGRIQIFDVLAKRLVGELPSNADVRMLSFDRSRRRLFSAGKHNGEVEIWRIPKIETFGRRRQSQLQLNDFYSQTQSGTTQDRLRRSFREALAIFRDLATDKPETLTWDNYRSK
jgi:WD40 repeat protein